MNNREIKFRSWNEAEKKYFIPFIGARIDLGLTYFETHIKCAYPEQFTGIKDKNGKEIYEGDIVNCYDNAAKDELWGFDKEHSGTIIYVGNSFSLKCGDVYLIQWISAENIEVIGNIHENPELLNG